MSNSLKSNLITTTALQGAYIAASDPKLKESSTVPFWEDVLNEYMRDDNMLVYSQQPMMSNSTQAVDLTVAYYDPSFQKVFMLVVECKRHKYTTLAEMEFVNLRNDVQNFPLFGGKGKSSEEFYRDPKTTGAEIHAALLEAKALRNNAALSRPGGTSFPSGGTPFPAAGAPFPAAGAPPTTQLARGAPFSAGGTPGRLQIAAPATSGKVTFTTPTDPRTIKYILDGRVYSSPAEECADSGIIFFNASRNLYASKSST
ncbi:uncharacterized protein CDV56_102099 [Aspergillus thermomutatus]|uniref:Uncharacterized protein n=1 Tax=Aspergillus thermomutatus TaxID=41047 RepID=A0A397GBB1_ASPTH|nr:uncharacterized protein CDV56_102099 [Aspergillus thermomutatus]RHZ46253.1 hypothetical protein CDV56_102099 [Aspergillus thermomutatus]